MEQYSRACSACASCRRLCSPGPRTGRTATASKVQELIDHRGVRTKQIIALIEKGYTTDRQIRNALYPEIQPGLRRAAGGQLRRTSQGWWARPRHRRGRRQALEGRADALTPRLLRCRGPTRSGGGIEVHVRLPGADTARHATKPLTAEPVKGERALRSRDVPETGDWAPAGYPPPQSVTPPCAWRLTTALKY